VGRAGARRRAGAREPQLGAGSAGGDATDLFPGVVGGGAARGGVAAPRTDSTNDGSGAVAVPPRPRRGRQHCPRRCVSQGLWRRARASASRQPRRGGSSLRNHRTDGSRVGRAVHSAPRDRHLPRLTVTSRLTLTLTLTWSWTVTAPWTLTPPLT